MSNLYSMLVLSIAHCTSLSASLFLSPSVVSLTRIRASELSRAIHAVRRVYYAHGAHWLTLLLATKWIPHVEYIRRDTWKVHRSLFFSSPLSPPLFYFFIFLYHLIIASLAHCFSSGTARLHADVVVIIIVETVEVLEEYYEVQERVFPSCL